MELSIADVLNGGGMLAFAALVYIETRRVRELLGVLVERVTRLEERVPTAALTGQWTPPHGIAAPRLGRAPTEDDSAR